MNPQRPPSVLATARARVSSLPALIALGLWLVPSVAKACPVCFQAQNEENRIAFVLTTVFLSLLPLGMIGGLIFWVRRKVILQHALEAAYAPVSVHGAAGGISDIKDPAS